MIGLSVYLYILVRKFVDVIFVGFIIWVLFVLIFGRGVVGEVMFVSLFMGFLSVGFILCGIVFSCVRMVEIVVVVCVFLFICLSSCDCFLMWLMLLLWLFVMVVCMMVCFV